MTDSAPTNARRDALRAATLSLLDKLLAVPDEAGVEHAARQLGMWENGQVRAGQDDEVGALLDYYLFDVEADGATRIQAFLEEPPPGLSDDEKTVLAALAAPRLDVFKVKRSEDGEVDLEAALGGEPATIYDPDFPVTAHGATVAARVFVADGVGLHTGNALRLRRRQAQFILDHEAVYDLAKVLDGHDDLALDTLSHRVLLRAIIAVRAAQDVIGKGERAFVSKPRREKRSLGRRDDKRKRR